MVESHNVSTDVAPARLRPTTMMPGRVLYPPTWRNGLIARQGKNRYTVGSGIEINDSGSRTKACKWTIQYLGVAVVYHINDFLESHQNLLAGPVDLNKKNCRYFFTCP